MSESEINTGASHSNEKPLRDLELRLSEAKDASRHLDAAIAVITFETISTGDNLIYARACRPDDNCAPGHFWRKSRSGASLQSALAYTSSLDAAVEFAEMHTEHAWLLGRDNESAEATIYEAPNQVAATARAPTVALALCLATIRALIGMRSAHGQSAGQDTTLT